MSSQERRQFDSPDQIDGEREGVDIAGTGGTHEEMVALRKERTVAKLKLDLNRIIDQIGEHEEEQQSKPSQDWSATRHKARSKFYSQVCQLKYRCLLTLALACFAAFQLIIVFAAKLAASSDGHELLERALIKLNLTAGQSSVAQDAQSA